MFLHPSHHHPLSRWMQRVKSVSACVCVCVCVGESERERVGAILGRLGKSWLPGVWEKCSWQVLNRGIPLCCSVETLTHRQTHKLDFVTQGDVASSHICSLKSKSYKCHMLTVTFSRNHNQRLHLHTASVLGFFCFAFSPSLLSFLKHTFFGSAHTQHTHKNVSLKHTQSRQTKWSLKREISSSTTLCPEAQSQSFPVTHSHTLSLTHTPTELCTISSNQLP